MSERRALWICLLGIALSVWGCGGGPLGSDTVEPPPELPPPRQLELERLQSAHFLDKSLGPVGQRRLEALLDFEANAHDRADLVAAALGTAEAAGRRALRAVVDGRPEIFEQAAAASLRQMSSGEARSDRQTAGALIAAARWASDQGWPIDEIQRAAAERWRDLPADARWLIARLGWPHPEQAPRRWRSLAAGAHRWRCAVDAPWQARLWLEAPAWAEIALSFNDAQLSAPPRWGRRIFTGALSASPGALTIEISSSGPVEIWVEGEGAEPACFSEAKAIARPPAEVTLKAEGGLSAEQRAAAQRPGAWGALRRAWWWAADPTAGDGALALEIRERWRRRWPADADLTWIEARDQREAPQPGARAPAQLAAALALAFDLRWPPRPAHPQRGGWRSEAAVWLGEAPWLLRRISGPGVEAAERPPEAIPLIDLPNEQAWAAPLPAADSGWIGAGWPAAALQGGALVALWPASGPAPAITPTGQAITGQRSPLQIDGEIHGEAVSGRRWALDAQPAIPAEPGQPLAEALRSGLMWRQRPLAMGPWLAEALLPAPQTRALVSEILAGEGAERAQGPALIGALLRWSQAHIQHQPAARWRRPPRETLRAGEGDRVLALCALLRAAEVPCAPAQITPPAGVQASLHGEDIVILRVGAPSASQLIDPTRPGGHLPSAAYGGRWRALTDGAQGQIPDEIPPTWRAALRWRPHPEGWRGDLRLTGQACPELATALRAAPEVTWAGAVTRRLPDEGQAPGDVARVEAVTISGAGEPCEIKGLIVLPPTAAPTLPLTRAFGPVGCPDLIEGARLSARQTPARITGGRCEVHHEIRADAGWRLDPKWASFEFTGPFGAVRQHIEPTGVTIDRALTLRGALIGPGAYPGLTAWVRQALRASGALVSPAAPRAED